MVLPERRHHLLGLGRLREGGEPSQVGEEHGHLLAVAPEHALVVGGHDQVGQLRGEEPSEPAQPVHLADLLGHPGLEGGVPLGQGGGLALDDVVVLLHPEQRLHPGQQLGLVERFDHEVVGAGFEGLELLGRSAGRDHDHR